MGVRQARGPNQGVASGMTLSVERKSEGRPVCKGGKGACVGWSCRQPFEHLAICILRHLDIWNWNLKLSLL